VSNVLTGRRLRYAVAVLLHEAGDTLSLDELANRLHAWGFTTAVEPRKAISDALRWERHRRRAVRVGRGRYRSLGLARSTDRWMRAQVVGDGAW
jgi:hypothetical protein